MSDIQHKFVLCVDDDPDDRLMIGEAFRDLDPSVQVLEAGNGREAHKILESAKTAGKFPALVILDINMPLMDGKETLIEMKKDEKLRSLPVVFFSTSANPRDRSFSEDHGVEFVTKPSNYRTIVETIRGFIDRYVPA